MPFKLQDASKLLHWQLVNGTPATQSEPIGEGFYVMICPLCGGIHEIKAGTPAHSRLHA